MRFRPHQLTERSELDTKDAKIEATRALVRKLPLPNLTLLRALSSFLITIVDNSTLNKMTVRNGRKDSPLHLFSDADLTGKIVGIVFSPTLNIPAPVLSMFMSDFNIIFDTRPDEKAGSGLEVIVAPPAEMTPEDIRSPRRQLFQDLPTPSYQQSSFPKGGASHASTIGPTTYPPGFTPLQPAHEPPRFGQHLVAYGHGHGQGQGQDQGLARSASGRYSHIPAQGPGQGQSQSQDYASLNGALVAPPPSLPPPSMPPPPPPSQPPQRRQSSNEREVKAKRRESSMLLMPDGVNAVNGVYVGGGGGTGGGAGGGTGGLSVSMARLSHVGPGESYAILF